MPMKKFIVGFICAFFCLQSSTYAQSSGTYVAVVVEHAPTIKPSPIDTILENVKYYRSVLEANANAQIVVFPEYGLTGFIDNPTEFAIQLDNLVYPYTHHKALEDLSDMAKEYGLYLVVNLLEKSNSSKSWLYYNTNLVFDKSGKIAAKYRKINLYNESSLTPGNEIVTFTTDFGVNFGIFTCADILFDRPSREILRNSSVTDIVFPTAWTSILPFYSALSVQSGYAIANGVNLLAANYNNPRVGIGGSGIYSSNQKPEIYIDSSHSSKAISKELPKRVKRDSREECSLITPHGLPGESTKPDLSKFNTSRDFTPSLYKFKDIDLKANNSFEICMEKLCCYFEVNVTNSNNNEIYKALAYEGTTRVDTKDIHVQICSVVACESASVNTCGQRRIGMTDFTTLRVVAKADNTDNNTFYTPITLTNDLQPAQKVSYCNRLNNSNKSYTSELNLLQHEANIIVFGIFGQVPSSALNNQAGVLLILTFVLAFVVKNIL